MIKRSIVCLCFGLFFCGSALAQVHNSKAPFPDQFTIGRHTFFDFGPPTDFYEIFSVQATEMGASIERINVTPHGDACMQPATVQTETASINESISDLLGQTNLAPSLRKTFVGNESDARTAWYSAAQR